LTRQVKRLERREEVENKLHEAQIQLYSRQWSEIDEHHQALESEVDKFDQKKRAAETEMKETQRNLEKIEKEKTTNEAFQQLQKEYNQILEEKNKFLEEQAELKNRLEMNARQEGAADLVWITKRRDEIERRLQDQREELAVITESNRRMSQQLKEKETEQRKVLDEFEALEQKIISVREGLKNQQMIKLEDIRYELDKLEAIQITLIKLSEDEDDENVLGKIKREIKRLQERLGSFRKRVDSSTEMADPKEYFELQTQLSSLFKTKDNMVNELALLRAQVDVKTELEKNLTGQVNVLETERSKLTTQINRAKEAPADKEEAYRQYLKANEEIRSRLEDIDNRLSSVRQKISEFSDVEQKKKEELFTQQKKFRDIQRQVNEIVNRLNERRVDLARTETRREDLEREMREALPAEQMERVFNVARDKSWDRSPHPDDLATEIQRHKHQLELIGGIEEGTADEYRETNERYEFLNKESNDLNDSINNLEQAIVELEETIKKRFDAAFEKINKEFQRFFKTLFDGGVARLSLIREVVVPEEEKESKNDDGKDEDEETKEKDKPKPAPSKQEKVITGIDIFASPPGKRLKGIGMLSGGERALTSIALICAIIYNNPSPFVVLDEVDAALDESNSRRFVSILEKLVNRTQFITITHNRATMERSNILYGVTMGSEGVSKLLSMKLEDANEVIKATGNR
jgi:chromosome segregation protein